MVAAIQPTHLLAWSLASLAGILPYALGTPLGIVLSLDGDMFENAEAILFTQGENADGGFVDYLDAQEAAVENLHYTEGFPPRAILKADSSSPATVHGRKSVRAVSVDAYDEGLFVISLNHVPEGCGVAPTIKLIPQDTTRLDEVDLFADGGECDTNRVTLSTSEPCRMSAADSFFFEGSWDTSRVRRGLLNCQKTRGSTGCSVESSLPFFGSKLNEIGGGYIAFELSPLQYVRVWTFSNFNVPIDLLQGRPDPDLWTSSRKPIAHFSLGSECNVTPAFAPSQIAFDLSFCGNRAGTDFHKSACGGPGGPFSSSSKCEEFVRNNPGAFVDAYWDINYLRVFQASSSDFSQYDLYHGPPWPTTTPTPPVPTLPPTCNGRSRPMLLWRIISCLFGISLTSRNVDSIVACIFSRQQSMAASSSLGGELFGSMRASDRLEPVPDLQGDTSNRLLEGFIPRAPFQSDRALEDLLIRRVKESPDYSILSSADRAGLLYDIQSVFSGRLFGSCLPKSGLNVGFIDRLRGPG